MKTAVILCMGVGMVLLGTHSVWGVQTSAWAQVVDTSQNAYWDSDSDTGGLDCSSSAYKQLPSGTWSSAYAHGYWSSDLHKWVMDTDLDGNIVTVGETYQNSASVYIFGSGDDEWVTGPGTSADFGLQIGHANLKVSANDLAATTTIDMNLTKDGEILYSGMAQLDSSGDFTGSGIYVESFFDIFFDLSTDTWNAAYIGPGTMSFSLPVGEPFDLVFQSGAGKMYGGGGGGGGGLVPEIENASQSMGLTIPAGYDLLPEPMTMALLGAGVLLLRTRRRK